MIKYLITPFIVTSLSGLFFFPIIYKKNNRNMKNVIIFLDEGKIFFIYTFSISILNQIIFDLIS